MEGLAEIPCRYRPVPPLQNRIHAIRPASLPRHPGSAEQLSEEVDFTRSHSMCKGEYSHQARHVTFFALLSGLGPEIVVHLMFMCFSRRCNPEFSTCSFRFGEL
jgi:hypothetical protein